MCNICIYFQDKHPYYCSRDSDCTNGYRCINNNGLMICQRYYTPPTSQFPGDCHSNRDCPPNQQCSFDTAYGKNVCGSDGFEGENGIIVGNNTFFKY